MGEACGKLCGRDSVEERPLAARGSGSSVGGDIGAWPPPVSGPTVSSKSSLAKPPVARVAKAAGRTAKEVRWAAEPPEDISPASLADHDSPASPSAVAEGAGSPLPQQQDRFAQMNGQSSYKETAYERAVEMARRSRKTNSFSSEYLPPGGCSDVAMLERFWEAAAGDAAQLAEATGADPALVQKRCRDGRSFAKQYLEGHLGTEAVEARYAREPQALCDEDLAMAAGPLDDCEGKQSEKHSRMRKVLVQTMANAYEAYASDSRRLAVLYGLEEELLRWNPPAHTREFVLRVLDGDFRSETM